jgi:MFS family permease
VRLSGPEWINLRLDVLRAFSGIAHRLVGRQLTLLGGIPSLRLLASANFLSGVGTWLAFVALTVDVWDRTESGTWVAALLIADFLPVIVIGLSVGPLVDRLSRRGLMVAADVARFGVFFALPFAANEAQIVGLAALAAFATGFFRPAVYAGLPNLVDDSDLPSANALLQSTEALTTVIGSLAGGLLVAASGPAGAYWINAGTFLLSAALIVRIPAGLLQADRVATHGHWRDLAEGFQFVRGSRALLTVLIAWNVGIFGNGGVNVAEIKLAKVSFDAGDFGFGLMLASAGVGVVLGSLSAGSWVQQRGIAGVYGAGLGLIAIGIAAAAAAPNVWVAAPCVAVSGAGNGIALVCNALLVQRGAPDRVRGRIFTVLMGSNYAVLLAGMLVAGPLTNEYGARWVWGGAAAVAAVAAVVGYFMARGIRAEEQVQPAPLVIPETQAHAEP